MMRRRAAKLVFALSAVALLAGCGDDGPEGPSEEGLQDAFIAYFFADAGDAVSPEEQTCIAEGVIENIGYERLRDAYVAAEENFELISAADPAFAEEANMALAAAITECLDETEG